MYTHIVVYSLAEGADAADIVARLKTFITLAPLVTTLDAGIDVSRTPSSYDIGLVTTHPDAAAYEAYRTHPTHLEFVDWLLPQLSGRTVVDFES